MASVRVFGKQMTADPVTKFDNGDWLMRAHEHGPRNIADGEIRVRPDEILEMTEPVVVTEYTPSPEAIASATALEAAMAKERETIPSVESILRPIQEAAKPVRAAEAAAVTGERAGPFPKK
jgi:hypothetical protein